MTIKVFFNVLAPFEVAFQPKIIAPQEKGILYSRYLLGINEFR